MDLWSPPHDAPHLFEWWRPLLLVSRRARIERFPWPVHLDEFRLAGRVRRQGRPDIWIYDHHENRGSVCVDATGQTYKFVATPRGKAVGRFQPCDLRTALWRARLPDVVDPVRYGEPAQPSSAEWTSADEAAVAAAEAAGRTSADDASVGPAFGRAGRPGDPSTGGIAPAGAVSADGGGPDEGDDAGGVDDDGGPRVIRRGHLTLIAG
jgi:hypothetical protein